MNTAFYLPVSSTAIISLLAYASVQSTQPCCMHCARCYGRSDYRRNVLASSDSEERFQRLPWKNTIIFLHHTLVKLFDISNLNSVSDIVSLKCVFTYLKNHILKLRTLKHARNENTIFNSIRYSVIVLNNLQYAVILYSTIYLWYYNPFCRMSTCIAEEECVYDKMMSMCLW